MAVASPLDIPSATAGTTRAVPVYRYLMQPPALSVRLPRRNFPSPATAYRIRDALAKRRVVS